MNKATGRQIAAFIAQVGSYLTTYLFFAAFIDDMIVRLIVSITVEAVFYYLKEMLLSNGEMLGVVALLFDTLFNAGGLYFSIKGMDKTPTFKMLSEVFTESGQPATLDKLTVFLIALGIGFILSLAPHSLRRSKANVK